MKHTKIVIAGGGFAGLSAAMHLDKTLARRVDIEVTLISRENFILFTPMLHEVVGGDLFPSIGPVWQKSLARNSPGSSRGGFGGPFTY